MEDMLVCKIVMLDSLCEKDRSLAEQEVGLLRSLDHKNIVRFHECLHMLSGSSLGLVMEYCHGGDLRHVIRDQAKTGHYFQESQIMTWFVQIVTGLRYLHSRRILHRDLKTSNIFLKGPAPYTCLIGDLGISRILEESLGAVQTVIGTPYYLSPEVCKKEPYSYKSDIWSLGACLYELTMLRMAFKSSNLLDLVNKIIHDPYDPVDQEVFSPYLVNLIGRLLSKNPSDRPSGADLMRDIYVRNFYTEIIEVAPPMPIDAPRRPPTLRGRRTAPLIESVRAIVPAPHADLAIPAVLTPDEDPTESAFPQDMFSTALSLLPTSSAGPPVRPVFPVAPPPLPLMP